MQVHIAALNGELCFAAKDVSASLQLDRACGKAMEQKLPVFVMPQLSRCGEPIIHYDLKFMTSQINLLR